MEQQRRRTIVCLLCNVVVVVVCCCCCQPSSDSRYRLTLKGGHPTIISKFPSVQRGDFLVKNQHKQDMHAASQLEGRPKLGVMS